MASGFTVPRTTTLSFSLATLSVAVMLPCVAGEICSEYDSNPDFSMDMTNGPLDAVLKSKLPSAPLVV